jgi:ankyrin repeat protein
VIKDWNIPNEQSRTGMHIAAARGHEAVVEVLLAKDSVGPDSKDINNQTPLK